MDTLVIRLSERDDAPVTWLSVDADGRALDAVQTGTLDRAHSFSAGRRVVLLVPGVEVSLAEPELPVKGGARLAQVIPFALEEQVADDVDTLHFAAGKRLGERPGTPVAIVARARMDAWLGRVRAAGMEPAAVYSDASALPDNPAHSIVLLEENRLYVRHPDRLPVVLDAEPLESALEIAEVYGTGETVTAHLILYATEEQWQKHQQTLEEARERVGDLNVQLLPNGALPLLATQVVTAPPLNLLQGTYAGQSNVSGDWRRWRIAALLFGCLIGLNLVGKGVELWQLKRAERTLDTAIEQTFREAVPGEQNATNARRRMEARLMQVHGGNTSGGGLLQSLSSIGRAVSQVPQTALDAMSFRGTTLDLKVAAKDVNSLGQLQTLVSQQGLSAQLQSSNARASGVEGLIQITAPGKEATR